MAEIFKQDNDSYKIEVPKEKRYLNTMSYDYSVQYLYDLINRGKIVLEVPFQRQQIWKADQASSLLESIIMNVPIPPLYFAEEENGNWLVLDGLQRLSSIANFYNNEFALKNLEVLKMNLSTGEVDFEIPVDDMLYYKTLSKELNTF